MAAIHANGTTGHRPRLLDSSGSSLRGRITATYNQLQAAFGAPDTEPSLEPEWVVLIHTAPEQEPNQRASIYPPDILDDPRRSPDLPMTWHIGGYCNSFMHDGRRITLADAINNALARVAMRPNP